MNIKIDKNKFYVVGLSVRKGTRLFMTKLEYEHYKPSEPRNDLINFDILTWQNLVFYITNVPMAEKDICYQVAKELGMSIVDGTPLVIDHTGKHYFPLSDSNVFTLEGQYEGDEGKECERLFKNDNDDKENYRKHITTRMASMDEISKWLNDLAHAEVFGPVHGILFGGDRYSCCNAACIAYLNNGPIGAVTISHRGEQNSGQPTIVGLYVGRKMRRMGVGTELLTKAIKYCQDNNLIPVRVDVLSKSAKNLIDKLPDNLKSCLKIYDYRGPDLAEIDEKYYKDEDWIVGVMNER